MLLQEPNKEANEEVAAGNDDGSATAAAAAEENALERERAEQIRRNLQRMQELNVVDAAAKV